MNGQSSSTWTPSRCLIHGPYVGFMCPSCTSSTSPQPLPQPYPPQPAIKMDPTPTLMRIAAALERIASALEGGETE